MQPFTGIRIQDKLISPPTLFAITYPYAEASEYYVGGLWPSVAKRYGGRWGET
jgi:hypothetical protein